MNGSMLLDFQQVIVWSLVHWIFVEIVLVRLSSR